MIETSPLFEQIPGLIHAFSTRQGGKSSGSFESLNLGFNTLDEPNLIEDNLHRLCKKLQIPRMFEVQQVHGNRVILAEEFKSRQENADAIISRSPETAIGIRTADCAPILIAHRTPDGRADMIGAVHAGWRSATTNILIKAVKAMCANGADQNRLVFAIGPCIGPLHFEVGMEVIHAAEKCLSRFQVPFEAKENGKALFDLKDYLVRQLREIGIKEGAIHEVGACTYTNSERYFSHRRDEGRTGRHLSCIMLTSSSANS